MRPGSGSSGGSSLYITGVTSPLGVTFAPDGTFTGALFFLTDITERREAEAERQAGEGVGTDVLLHLGRITAHLQPGRTRRSRCDAAG